MPDKSLILVPVDFSACSRAALLYGAKLATLMKQHLLVVHVVHDPGEAPGFYAKRRKSKSLRKMEDVAQQALDEFVKDVAGEAAEFNEVLLSAGQLLVSGLPASRILEIAEREEVMQVVMGSQGRTSLAYFLLGSKTERVVRMCTVPVTVVKAGEGGQD